MLAAVAGLAYLFLAALFTQPLIFNAADHTATADNSADQFQTIWFFWWMKKALFVLGQNPYWTSEIYFPYGTGLGHHLSPFTNLMAIAISTMTGQPINSLLVFNLLLFASFVITGWAAFVLIRQLTGHPLAAFLGSIFVVVSPYRLWHLNHLNLLSFGWGLFALHFTIRFLNRPRAATLVAAVAFFGATFYSSLTNTSLIGFLILAYVCASARDLLMHPRKKQIVLGSLIGAGLALLIAWPGLAALRQTDSVWNLPWQQTESLSANLLGYVIPSQTTSWVGRWFDLDSGPAPGWGCEIFLGWLLVALSIGVLVLSRRTVSRRWLALAGVFLVISVGPTLQVGSYRILEGFWPYRWLFETVPYLNLSRAPVRFGVLTQLCLAVFTAQGLAVGLEKLRRSAPYPRRRTVFLILSGVAVTGILFVEYSDGHTELSPKFVPEFYYELAGDPSIDAVYKGPIDDASRVCNYYMYWQTIHERKVANGYLTHHSPSARMLLDRIEGWRDLGPTEHGALLEAGIDAVLYHNADGSIRPIRLH
jgi:hypothetical protein